MSSTAKTTVKGPMPDQPVQEETDAQPEVKTAEAEARRMQALSAQGSQSIAYMNAQAALNISEGIKNGKVQTIVVPANFNALMMPK